MDTLLLIAIACSAGLAYFAYRIVWVTRRAGPYPMRHVPLVAPGGGA